jgi:hypothetical protein
VGRRTQKSTNPKKVFNMSAEEIFLSTYSEEQKLMADEIIRSYFEGLNYYQASMLVACINEKLDFYTKVVSVS